MKLACFTFALMLTATGCVSITTGPYVGDEPPGEPSVDGAVAEVPDGQPSMACDAPAVSKVGQWETDDEQHSAVSHTPMAKLATDGARVFMVDSGTRQGDASDVGRGWVISLRELTPGANRTAVVLGSGQIGKAMRPHVSIAMDHARLAVCWDDASGVHCTTRDLATGNATDREWLGSDPVVLLASDGEFHVAYAGGYGISVTPLATHAPMLIPNSVSQAPVRFFIVDDTYAVVTMQYQTEGTEWTVHTWRDGWVARRLPSMDGAYTANVASNDRGVLFGASTIGYQPMTVSAGTAFMALDGGSKVTAPVATYDDEDDYQRLQLLPAAGTDSFAAFYFATSEQLAYRALDARGNAVGAPAPFGETGEGQLLEDTVTTNNAFMVATKNVATGPSVVSVWELRCDGAMLH